MSVSARPTARWLAGGVVALLLGAAGCAAQTVPSEPGRRALPTAADPPSAEVDNGDPAEPRSSKTPKTASYAVAAPGRRTGRLYTADVLLTSERSLSGEVARRVRRVPGVEAAEPMGVSSSSVNGRTLTVAAVDAAGFRRFVPQATADAQRLWDRLAGGELAVDQAVSRKLVGTDDMMALSTREDAPVVHVGGYAPLVQRVMGVGESRPALDVLVNTRRGAQLGIPHHNALLVSTGTTTPSEVVSRLARIAGPDATVQVLALEFEDTAQTAVLTGRPVTGAVGTFTYTNGPEGTIVPDSAWVREYIRTEEVPILGAVTCNKGMLPQLRGALAEIERLGLSGEIHPEEYAGCYYPRYIARNPANGLSLHSWGIAVDLNVPGNQRGTVGEMDRRVVAVFKAWGFAWGGDWNYTDPMHFEMNAVTR